MDYRVETFTVRYVFENKQLSAALEKTDGLTATMTTMYAGCCQLKQLHIVSYDKKTAKIVACTSSDEI